MSDGETLTFRLVEIAPRQNDDVAEVILAHVYEDRRVGFYAGWRPFDGEYGIAVIRADAASAVPPAAAIARELEAMLEATRRPILHVGTDMRMVERCLEDWTDPRAVRPVVSSREVEGYPAPEILGQQEASIRMTGADWADVISASRR